MFNTFWSSIACVAQAFADLAPGPAATPFAANPAATQAIYDEFAAAWSATAASFMGDDGDRDYLALHADQIAADAAEDAAPYGWSSAGDDLPPRPTSQPLAIPAPATKRARKPLTQEQKDRRNAAARAKRAAAKL